MKTSIILFTGFILIQSCAPKKDQNNIKSLSGSFLTLSDSITFQLIDTLKSGFSELQYVPEEDVVIVNGGHNILTWYDMTTGNPVKSNRYEREGPNGAGNLKGFYYHNKDSIFTFSRYEVVLFGAGHSAYNRYRIKGINEKRGESTASLDSKATINQAVLLDDFLFIPSVEDRSNYNVKQRMTRLNLLNNEIKHYMGYPDIYRNGYKWTLEQCANINTVFVPGINKFATSYPSDKYVYFSKDLIDFQPKLAKSKYFEEEDIVEYKNDFKNPFPRVTYYLNNYNYGSFLYDRFRDVYYRVNLHPLKITDKEVEAAAMLNTGFAISYSISMFSGDMKKIAEQDFSGEIFRSQSFIIHPKGLYIQSKNTHDENKRTFYLMKFNEKMLP